MNIGFLGGGNMTTAMVLGLLSTNFSLYVVDKNADKCAYFADLGIWSSHKMPDVPMDAWIVAVKPDVLLPSVRAIKSHLEGKLVISVAAALPLASIANELPNSHIVRAMPNTPVAKNSGVIGLYALNRDERATLIFSKMGQVIWFDDEERLHAVTAIAGSAPAYFFYILEAMIACGVRMGLSANEAHAMAVGAMKGTAMMAKDDDPSTLRQKVTSKGGTTAAAIGVFENEKLHGVIASAMLACYDKSIKMERQ